MCLSLLPIHHLSVQYSASFTFYSLFLSLLPIKKSNQRQLVLFYICTYLSAHTSHTIRIFYALSLCICLSKITHMRKRDIRLWKASHNVFRASVNSAIIKRANKTKPQLEWSNWNSNVAKTKAK